MFYVKATLHIHTLTLLTSYLRQSDIIKLVYFFLSATCTEIGESSAPLKRTTREADMARVTRGRLSMLRLGRGIQMLRLGKRVPSEGYDSYELHHLLLALLEEEKKHNTRQPPLPRYGKSLDDEFESEYPDLNGVLRRSGADFLLSGDDLMDTLRPTPRMGRFKRALLEEKLEEGRAAPLPRIGKDLDSLDMESEEREEKAVPMPRIGRYLGDDDDESQYDRAVPFPRIGREEEEDELEGEEKQKRGSISMLRLGKRPTSMLRLGKRPTSMLRLGKRPMSMLRLGKRPMSMLRLGKRPTSMLRLGKRPTSMLRLGKRPTSMLRLGKRATINDMESNSDISNV